MKIVIYDFIPLALHLQSQANLFPPKQNIWYNAYLPTYILWQVFTFSNVILGYFRWIGSIILIFIWLLVNKSSKKDFESECSDRIWSFNQNMDPTKPSWSESASLPETHTMAMAYNPPSASNKYFQTWFSLMLPEVLF